ncbi:hypothetical protein ACS0TY_016448 [Phlomoides rotata]
MGSLWKDDDSGYFSSGSGDRCSTRKVVKSKCHTEEVESGRFIRKCEKSQQIFKDCVGRPSEMIESNEEYTEEDVTNQMVKGSFPLESAEPPASPYFPGLRSDIEAIERRFLGEMYRFFEDSEEMKKDFFNSFRIFDSEPPSRGVPSEAERALPREKDLPETPKNDDIDARIIDLGVDV